MSLLRRIVKEDGVKGLFTGAGPTVVRAMSLNMGMLASNDQVGNPSHVGSPSHAMFQETLCLNTRRSHTRHKMP